MTHYSFNGLSCVNTLLFLKKLAKLGKNRARDFSIKKVEFRENFHASIVQWEGGNLLFFCSLPGWMIDHLIVSSHMF